jgi:hypothetical protein
MNISDNRINTNLPMTQTQFIQQVKVGQVQYHASYIYIFM